jgi:hypothetical protein
MPSRNLLLRMALGSLAGALVAAPIGLLLVKEPMGAVWAAAGGALVGLSLAGRLVHRAGWVIIAVVIAAVWAYAFLGKRGLLP